MRHRIRAASAAIGAVLAVAALPGCMTSATTTPSNPVVLPGPSADTVVQFVKERTGADARNVVCPDGIEAVIGVVFDCTFDGPDGAYVAHTRIVSVAAPRVDYVIETERRG